MVIYCLWWLCFAGLLVVWLYDLVTWFVRRRRCLGGVTCLRFRVWLIWFVCGDGWFIRCAYRFFVCAL